MANGTRRVLSPSLNSLGMYNGEKFEPTFYIEVRTLVEKWNSQAECLVGVDVLSSNIRLFLYPCGRRQTSSMKQ